jgi:glycine cleavage system aminomethyltransferase T
LKARIPTEARAVLTDVTSGLAVLGVMGPKSRDFLSACTNDDLSNAGFPFAGSREIELGYGLVRASRVTYVGELGWEIYLPSEFSAGILEALLAVGSAFGLALVGMHAVNSLRIEKAYRHWGHDIGDEDTPLEAGLGFAVAWDKPGGFIGLDALLAQRDQGVNKRLAQFVLKDPEPLLYHNEPIWRDGEITGYVTSGMYGHTLGAAVGLGYVSNKAGVDADYVATGSYEIEIAGERFAAKASLKPLYDPASRRVRG